MKKKPRKTQNQEPITQAEPKGKADEQGAEYRRWYSSSDC